MNLLAATAVRRMTFRGSPPTKYTLRSLRIVTRKENEK